MTWHWCQKWDEKKKKKNGYDVSYSTRSFINASHLQDEQLQCCSDAFDSIQGLPSAVGTSVGRVSAT